MLMLTIAVAACCKLLRLNVEHNHIEPSRIQNHGCKYIYFQLDFIQHVSTPHSMPMRISDRNNDRIHKLNGIRYCFLYSLCNHDFVQTASSRRLPVYSNSSPRKQSHSTRNGKHEMAPNWGGMCMCDFAILVYCVFCRNFVLLVFLNGSKLCRLV